MPRISVKLEGLNKLMRKLDASDPVYAEPWREAIKKGTAQLEERVDSRAPMKTGRLVSSTTHRIDPRPIPLFGVVTASAENKGYRYPFSLEAGKGKKYKSGAYSVTHFRTGSKRGKSTRGWFSGARRGFGKVLQGLLATAARQIEAKWGQ